jgi:hypothetical protein
MTDFDSLVPRDRRELVRWCLAGGDDVARLTGQEHLALLYLLTTKVRKEAAEIPKEEWPDLARAYDVVLSMTPYNPFDAVAHRFNLMSVLLRTVLPRTDVPLLNPDAAARLFFEILPLSREEAVRLSADWRSEDIADIRQLRWIKNLLTPLERFSHLIGDAELSARVAEWIDLRDRLP